MPLANARGSEGATSANRAVTVRERKFAKMLRRLPAVIGRPVRLEIHRDLRDRGGEVYAGAFLRERRIAFDASIARDRAEFARVFVHEVFHFVWLRLGNARRWSFEALLREELLGRARGDLGWSAEWRKRALQPEDPERRTRRWREYVCESFCDTAAWLFSGVHAHREYTLARRFRERRRRWFEQSNLNGKISI